MTQDDYINFGLGAARWNEETGTVQFRFNQDKAELDEEPALWPSDAARLGQWLSEYSNHEVPFYIYYRRSNKDHVVQDGDTLCGNTVNVPGPHSDSLKPVSEVTDHEWSLILSRHTSFCNQCWGVARRKGLWPEESPQQPPSFTCPECGDSVESINEMVGVTMVEHPDGRTHEIDRDSYENWRRGVKIDES